MNFLDIVLANGDLISERIPIEVPEGYEFEGILYHMDLNKDVIYFCSLTSYLDKAKGGQRIWDMIHKELPNDIGTEKVCTCEACGGKGIKCNWPCGDFCEISHECVKDKPVCPVCHGAPTRILKLIKVEVKQVDGETVLVEHWVEILERALACEYLGVCDPDDPHRADYCPLMKCPPERAGDRRKEKEAFEIVKSLAEWSEKYPRSRTYHTSCQSDMDGRLIEIEDMAKDLIKKQRGEKCNDIF